MFKLRAFGKPNASSRLAEFDCNVLVAAGIKRTDRVENLPSLFAYEAKRISLHPVTTFGGVMHILSKERACSAR